MRFLLKKCCPVAFVAVFSCLSPVRAADIPFLPPVDLSVSASPLSVDAQVAFEGLSALPTDAKGSAAGQLVALDIDLANSPGFSAGLVDGRLEVRYRMAFNNIAEGWNWYPLADPQSEDYYHSKFLPLKSVTVERGEYDHQDKIGETQRMKVMWRYDYFLAFEHLYDFYPRVADDDGGFVASLPAPAAGQGLPQLRMLALASLVEPLVAESSTFWKATYGKPVDFTLKKRYLMGRLEAVCFVDATSGRVMARLQRKTAP